MLTKLKDKVRALLLAQARAAYKIGLTPNVVSVSGVAMALLSAIAYSHVLLIPATVLLLLSGYCDALDGAMARHSQRATPFGGFLDSLLDRYADAVVYVGIIVGGLCSITWGLTALMGSLLVSYARARAEGIGIKVEAVGLMERAERLITLAIASIASLFWAPAMEVGVALLAVLTNLTVLHRALYVYKKLV